MHQLLIWTIKLSRSHQYIIRAKPEILFVEPIIDAYIGALVKFKLYLKACSQSCLNMSSTVVHKEVLMMCRDMTLCRLHWCLSDRNYVARSSWCMSSMIISIGCTTSLLKASFWCLIAPPMNLLKASSRSRTNRRSRDLICGPCIAPVLILSAQDV